MNKLRVLEIRQEIADKRRKIAEIQEAIMDRYRTIKDYTPDSDYTEVERVTGVILKFKKKIKKINKDIELAEMEIESISKHIL
jgi:hypothetical protein